MRYLLITALSAAVLSGCTTTGGIAPQYINPNTYNAYSCDGLSQEINRVSRLADSTEKQGSPLSSTGVGIGLAGGRGGIYPTISLGVGRASGASSQKKQTLARLYGEHDAMVVAARQKGCSFAGAMKIYGK
ncbi:MAG: hypothetical protein Q4B88_02215 [Moraxella sp.]|nr:hypothetical protein [Moraxella sp.]